MSKTRILVTGASGQLGSYVLRHLAADEAMEVAAWAGSDGHTRFGNAVLVVDLRRREIVEAAFREFWPDLILHTAAVCRVDVCHANPELAKQVNVEGTRWLVELAARHRSRLLYVSTDLVFDGQQGGYAESHMPHPISRYGESKLAGERVVLELPDAVVARVSLLFGPSLNGRPSFFAQQCQALRQRRSLTLFADEWRTPLSLATAASALVELTKSPVVGVVHVGGPERMSRWEMGQRLARSLGCDPALLAASRQSDAKLAEPRPRDVSLDSSRWRSLFPQHPWPPWDAAVAELGLQGKEEG